MAKADFLNQLQALGYNPQELISGSPGHITFEYEVPRGVGPNEGKRLLIGTVVNEAYPDVPPSAPHYKAKSIPGWVNVRQDKGFNAQSSFGDDWVYWSRNMDLWSKTDRNAKAYLNILQTILFRMNEV